MSSARAATDTFGAADASPDHGVIDMAHAPSGEHLATLLDLSNEILCVFDVETSVLWCNPALELALGYERGELLGMRMDCLRHPEETSSHRLGGAGTGWRQVSGVQARYLTKQGASRWLEWRIRLDADRGLAFGAARDVTEYRAAEDALHDNEARLHAILEHSPSAVFVKDLQGRYLMVNRQWSRLTGVPPEDAVGTTAAVSWPANAAEIAEQERRLLERGTSLVSDERMQTVDGPRDFIVVRFLLRDDDGSPYAQCGIGTDITDRKRFDGELAARDRLLATVLQASPDIITLMDREGRIRQVSEAERAMLGYRHEDPAERDMFALVHPDDFDAVGSAFIRMVTGTVSQLHTRYRVRDASGRWVTVDSRGQAVIDDRDRFAGAVVVSRDISARLESEQRLESAREAAEQASRAKSEFLSRMSHELRTPLNSVLGFSQLLQMDDLPVAQADAVDHILRAGRHLLDLIDEVLDIARIETGHLELSMVPVALADVISDAVELTRPIADRAEVGLRVGFDRRDGLAVHADRQRLLQVLLNLLSNAVKYNRPGGRVDITCEELDEGRVRLAVSDTGQGIRGEDLARVFEPFDRLGAEQSGVEGTGVGLALSRQLVERMGGALDVESVPDVGSTFVVELAGADVERDDGWSDAPAHVAGSERPDSSGGSFRVLLVEDNLTNLDLVERVLSRRPGVEVLAAMHGGLAIDLAREHLPDLILVDLQLPDMSGVVVLDRLVDDPSTAEIPVAVVSADAPARQVRQLLGRGVVGVLTKPLDVRALLSLVDAVRAARGA